MGVVVRTHDRIDADLIERWSTLHARCDASVFLTPQWCQTWLETIGCETTPLILEVILDGDTVAILPTCLRRSKGSAWLELQGAAQSAGDHLDLVTPSEIEDKAIDALIDHFEHAPDKYNGMRFANMRVESRFANGLIEWSRVRGFAYLENNRQELPFIKLPDSFDAYLQSLSSNMRYHIRRRKREAEHASATMQLMSTPDEVAPLLAAFFDLHENRWQREGELGAFANPAKRQFLESFCHKAAHLGWLRGYLLSQDGLPLGALLAFHYRSRSYFYQMGWQAGDTVASPGVLLLAAAIERAIAENLSVFDFLQGSETYKSRWTSSHAVQRTILIGCGRAARLTVTAMSLKESCKSIAKSVRDISRHKPAPSRGSATLGVDR